MFRTPSAFSLAAEVHERSGPKALVANRPPTPRRAEAMPVDKSRYKKGMFLIGPDHPGLGIVKPIVTTSFSLILVEIGAKPKSAQRVAIARAMRSFVRKYSVYGLAGGRHDTAADRPAR